MVDDTQKRVLWEFCMERRRNRFYSGSKGICGKVLREASPTYSSVKTRQKQFIPPRPFSHTVIYILQVCRLRYAVRLMPESDTIE